MLKVQLELGKAKKTSDNPFHKSKYADLEEVLDVIKPVLAANGLTFIQMPGEAGSLTTMIMHPASGEFFVETATVELLKKDPASVGAAITYMRRQGLSSATGLAQEDDDGVSQSKAKKSGKNPYDLAKELQGGEEAPQQTVWYYDLIEMDKATRELAEKLLIEKDCIWDDDKQRWESKSPIKRLARYELKTFIKK